MPTVQIPLYGEFTSKYGSVFIVDDDSVPTMPYYLNGFFEQQPLAQEELRKFSFCKRPGTEYAGDFDLSALNALTDNHRIQGVVNSFDKTRLVFYTNNGSNNKCWYFDGTTLTDRGTAPAGAGSWTATGPVVFTVLDGISYGANRYYAATDFTKGAVIDSTGNWTEITDTDFTGLTKVTNLCAMDGYLFVGTDNNRIYNSDLNTATAWDALSFLTAADTPGKLVWLSRIRNYLIAFKQHSIEFFEDTGNPTPGSPLTAQKQLNKRVGLASKSSVKEVSDGIIFLGISEHGKVELYKISKDSLELEIISNQFMEQTLGGFTKIDGAYSVDPDIAGENAGEAQVITFRGKEFYIIYLRDVTHDRTWVYDNDLKTWTRWATCTSTSGGSPVLDNNFTATQSVTFVKSGRLLNLLAQNTLRGASDPPFFVVISSDGATFGDNVAGDASQYVGYPMLWVSDIMDFGNRRRKFMDSFELLYDVYAHSGSPGDNNIKLYYRDADFNTDGTDNTLITHTIPYANDNSFRCIRRRLGSFRKRNFAVKVEDYTNLLPFRIWGIEVAFNVGETDQDT